MKKTLVLAAVSATFASAAHAQSSVTLYGIIDAGFTYVQNEAKANGDGTVGHGDAYRMTSGNLQGSRWGMRGAEDLGGGMKAIFTLESGFDVMNGRSGQGGRLFGRQAFVGLSSDYGTVTMGRQYDSVVDYLGPLTATGSWGGTYFAHPGDNDNANNSLRMNNSVKYQSANYAGLTFSGMYAFSNQAGGFADNRAYSVGAGYQNGGLRLGAAYLQTQGTNQNSTGAVQDGPFGGLNGVAIPSEAQRTWGLGGSYELNLARQRSVWCTRKAATSSPSATVRCALTTTKSTRVTT